MSNLRDSFVEFSDVEYTKFRKALLRTKGNELQCNFLKIARTTESFLEHMSKIPMVGNTTVPVIPEKLTENEFKEPPVVIESTLSEIWGLVTPAIACRPTFWAHVTLDHLRQGRIESWYLATNGGSLSGGLERIDHVLTDSSNRNNQLIDLCVRTVLRRLGGLPEARGNRSVYVDCPFARAWWRERWIKHASQGDVSLTKHLRIVLRTSQNYWEKLIDRVVFRNSTFGDENTRSAFLRSLAQFVRDNPGTELPRAADMQRLCRRATAYQGRQELSVLNDAELDALMAEVIKGR